MRVSRSNRQIDRETRGQNTKLRGEVRRADLNQPRGHEPARSRPILVLNPAVSWRAFRYRHCPNEQLFFTGVFI